MMDLAELPRSGSQGGEMIWEGSLQKKEKKVLFPKQQVWLSCMAVHLFANFILFCFNLCTNFNLFLPHLSPRPSEH